MKEHPKLAIPSTTLTTECLNDRFRHRLNIVNFASFEKHETLSLPSQGSSDKNVYGEACCPPPKAIVNKSRPFEPILLSLRWMVQQPLLHCRPLFASSDKTGASILALSYQRSSPSHCVPRRRSCRNGFDWPHAASCPRWTYRLQ